MTFNLKNNNQYLTEIEHSSINSIYFNAFFNKEVVIFGATGLIGKYLIDTIMYLNLHKELNCIVFAVSRDSEKAKERLSGYEVSNNLIFIQQDVNCEIDDFYEFKKDSILINAASNTHPFQYSQQPIQTIMTNVLGTYNVLNFASRNGIGRVLNLSTVEIYGEATSNNQVFSEESLGYIDSNSLRSGYPESKRVAESLCHAFIEEQKLDILSLRLPRIFGPTMLLSDSKASSQFIKNVLNNEDIVLKSNGRQEYSYLYVSDAVKAIAFVLALGKCGEVYNAADKNSNTTLLNFANTVSSLIGKEVIFDLPNETETKGFSKATRAIMDSSKLRNLGWSSDVNLFDGCRRTVDILSGGNLKYDKQNKGI